MNLPEGWKLVPIEPVYQMAEAMGVKWEQGDGFPSRWKSALAVAPTPPALGNVVVTTDETGRAVAVTRQDEEGRILSVIWEAPTPPAQEDEPVAWLSEIGTLFDREHAKEYDMTNFTPLYTHPADDKLRKAAEEAVPMLEEAINHYGKTELGMQVLANLKAALDGKNDLP